jgi:glycerol uptake facilitator-like aquaporin
MAFTGNLPWNLVLPYVLVQIAGAFAGVAAAHLMFDMPVFFASTHIRTGMPQWWAEMVATFGLMITIFGCIKHRITWVAPCVACYITAAYWFTASTSFANPAVTMARSLSDTFAGIAPENIFGFVGAQILGAAAATVLACWLFEARSANK